MPMTFSLPRLATFFFWRVWSLVFLFGVCFWLFLLFLMANLLMANLVTGLLSQPMPPSRKVP